ncbi:MAG: DNA mismatch repair endonuclease MutL [bacterium]
MPNIKVLPEDVRNFISCGEVIESPSSVVKELVENSIDAGSRRIDIKIQNSGMSLINVSDAGCGIKYAELPLALTSFATSKINTKLELSGIKTLGFRGEALASVCSIASVKIFSKPAGEPGGIICKEGEDLITHTHFDCPDGTNVEVRRLFFNAPVRKRFLKSSPYLKTEIVRVVQSFALSFNEVLFTLEIDGKNYLEGLVPDEEIPERIRKIFGFENAVVAEYKSETVFIRCFVFPSELKPSKRWQFVYVNRRPVHSPVLLKAAENAVSGYFPPGKFPPLFLYITVLPSLVDVNVHPTKREVKFQSPQSFYQVIYDVVKRKFAAEKPVEYNLPQSEAGAYAYAGVAERRPGKGEYFSPSKEAAFSSFRTPADEETSAGEEFFPHDVKWDEFFYVGVSHKKFLIFSTTAAIHIVDFHAACERINYEKFKKEAGEKPVPAQKLLIPAEMKLTPEEIEALEQNLNFLADIGLIILPGRRSIKISALPAGFRGSESEFIKDIANALLEGRRRPDIFAEIKDTVLKIVACHTSLRAGDGIKRKDAEVIIDGLKKCSEPLRCPHGRPVMLTLPVSKIDSMLGR